MPWKLASKLWTYSRFTDRVNWFGESGSEYSEFADQIWRTLSEVGKGPVNTEITRGVLSTVNSEKIQEKLEGSRVSKAWLNRCRKFCIYSTQAGRVCCWDNFPFTYSLLNIYWVSKLTLAPSVVSEIISWERSPKVVALMIGCWGRDIDGIVGCLRWVKVSWWDLSAVLGFLLSSSQPTNHISCHYRSLTQPTHS